MTLYRRGACNTCVYPRGLLFFLFAACLSIIISGCAGRNFSAIRTGIEERGHYINGVPFYRQKKDSCGPAALASVLSFWGYQASLEQITARVYLPELHGTLPMDMENYMRDVGFETTSSAGTIDELKGYIRRDVPAICLLDLGFGPYRQPHYVTVLGFDDVNAVLIIHDGSEASRVISYDKFEKEWSRAGHWMLIARPPSQKVSP